MQDNAPEQMPRACAPFRWRAIDWLTASPVAQGLDVAVELRASLFSRTPSLIASALMTSCVAVVIATRHPNLSIIIWAVLDVILVCMRLTFAGIIIRYRARNLAEAAPPNIASDISIFLSLVWFCVLGYGVGLCLTTGDAPIAVVGNLLAIGTLGAQCARVPGAPRLVALQYCVVCVPFLAGATLVSEPLMRTVSLMIPVYCLSMLSINRQLHRDYVEMIMGRQESRRLALRCPLTGLPNRRMFERSLLAAVSKSQPIDGVKVFVLCLDLDGFKAVNDRLGHPMGDLLLQQVALRLLERLPPNGLVARLGGDEFGVVLSTRAAIDAESYAVAVLATINRPFVLTEGVTATVGISIGLADAGAGIKTVDALFSEADQALYAAKRAGRDTFRWYEAPSPAIARPLPQPSEDKLHRLRPVLDITRLPIVNTDLHDAQALRG